MQPPAGCHGRRGIAWALGSPVLRVQQVDVTAARDIEGMSARTDQPPLLARERQVAVAYRAEEHSSSVTDSLQKNPAKSPIFLERCAWFAQLILVTLLALLLLLAQSRADYVGGTVGGLASGA